MTFASSTVELSIHRTCRPTTRDSRLAILRNRTRRRRPRTFRNHREVVAMTLLAGGLTPLIQQLQWRCRHQMRRNSGAQMSSRDSCRRPTTVAAAAAAASTSDWRRSRSLKKRRPRWNISPHQSILTPAMKTKTNWCSGWRVSTRSRCFRIWNRRRRRRWRWKYPMHKCRITTVNIATCGKHEMKWENEEIFIE